MTQQVEISSFDLRHENHRLKNKGAEKNLLGSILENGMREPLQGVEPKTGCPILLDGFKRLRCATKLKIGTVPYCCLGDDEALGMINLIRVSNQKNLGILEQAKLIDELMNTHKMGVGEIAMQLEMSKAWVSVRAGIIKDMSETLQNEIFNGRFPVYSYMYTIRPFMRINKTPKKEVDDFVKSVSGNGISTRDIEILANGYFKGSSDFREQIQSGNISWALNRLKDPETISSECSEFEQKMMRDLEIVQKYMQRVAFQSKDKRLKGNVFFSQANLLAGGILSNISTFERSMKEFYDKSRQA